MFGPGLPCHAGTEISVTTYHNDNLRTGWNARETSLTQQSVAGGGFQMLASASVDDQVDTQPLVVPNQSISGQGTHDVVYVATESDSVYAIDANTGQVLLRSNLGSPVPMTMLPGECSNNGPNIGIDSTPVIDLSSGTMYVITYALESGAQTFRVHALDLSTLTDKIPSVVISASAPLTNGKTYVFNPAVTRQRPALLLANGGVYAGFGSYCDVSANLSRGWVLGWQTGSLTPFASNHLDNARAVSPNSFFLSSVWMSGYGLAASADGDVYFVTGNSDYGGTSYSVRNNLSESVVSLSSDLSHVVSYFSPTGSVGVSYLDEEDDDFGGGGVMLLPEQPGLVPHLAAAAGKAAVLYLLNAKQLGHQGGYLSSKTIGYACYCGESYFKGSDGVGRVVASGGKIVRIFTVQTQAQGNPSLVLQSRSAAIPNGQNGGFFTSVSSNRTAAGTQVIWAVSRPTDSNPADVYLYAFDSSGNTLYSGLAGNWPNVSGNANIVPTVANGKVYVASDQELAIFGLAANGQKPAALPLVKLFDTHAVLAPGEHDIYGVVRVINGNLVRITRRDGESTVIDSRIAEREYRMAPPSLGHGLEARGTFDARGVLQAKTILHALNNAAMWPDDR